MRPWRWSESSRGEIFLVCFISSTPHAIAPLRLGERETGGSGRASERLPPGRLCCSPISAGICLPVRGGVVGGFFRRGERARFFQCSAWISFGAAVEILLLARVLESPYFFFLLYWISDFVWAEFRLGFLSATGEEERFGDFYLAALLRPRLAKPNHFFPTFPIHYSKSWTPPHPSKSSSLVTCTWFSMCFASLVFVDIGCFLLRHC